MKKKTLRRSLSLLCSLALMFSLAIPAFAVDNSPSSYEDNASLQEALEAVNKGYDIPEHTSQGPSYPFKSVDAFSMYSRNQIQMYAGQIIYDDYISAYYPLEFHERAILTSSGASFGKFVRYLTTDWAKAATYTWNESQTINWTATGSASLNIKDKVRLTLQLSKSTITQYGVGTTIPADASKWSKLGLAADFDITNFNVEGYEYNIETGAERVTYTYDGHLETPTVNTYLTVYYK